MITCFCGDAPDCNDIGIDGEFQLSCTSKKHFPLVVYAPPGYSKAEAEQNFANGMLAFFYSSGGNKLQDMLVMKCAEINNLKTELYKTINDYENKLAERTKNNP